MVDTRTHSLINMTQKEQLKLIEAVTNAMDYVYEERLKIIENKIDSLIKYTAGTYETINKIDVK